MLSTVAAVPKPKCTLRSLWEREAGAATHLGGLARTLGAYFDAGADSVAVAAGADGGDLQVVALVTAVVAQEVGRTVEV